MVSTAGRLLSDAHRTAQARLAVGAVASMATVWPLLDLRSLDATAPRWVAAATDVIDRHHQASAVLAAGYLLELRRLELGTDVAPFAPIPPSGLELAAVTTSLLVTGPYAFKAKLAAGMPWNQAVGQTIAGSSGAASRHALTGGRDVIVRTAIADPRAHRIRRLTSPGACDFCIRIAGYAETNPNLSGDFRCHDHCHCQPEPGYG